MTNALKVQKIAITAFVAVVMAFLFLNFFTVQAHAAGLLDETIDTAHEFSKYPIDNYQLDFYVDSSWDWLPWNWLDGIGKTAQYAIYLFTNFLWTLNLYISNAVGYLIQQAYDLDFISSAASEIGKNIQLIAGVSASGLDSTGLFPGMMAIVTLLVGVYCTYVGLVKRETTKAFHAALNFVVVFVVSVGLIAYAPSAISGVNEFSSDISNGIVDVSAKILAPDTAGENTGVSAIRDCLFGIQVKQPWLIMQFGDSDVENIGEERVNSLLGTSPDENRGKDREEAVKTELEDYDNGNLTVTEVTSRFGLSVFFLIFNLIVSAFAIMLTGSMLLSQILFIISAMFLPVSLLISMIPAFSGTSRRAVISLFNTIMLRVGTTLLTTFVLVLSSLAYTIANGKPFVVVLVSSKPQVLSASVIGTNGVIVDETPAEGTSALLWAPSPGMKGGQAIAEIILGETEPSGRLPITFPRHAGQLPVYYNQIRGQHGNRYADLTQDPAFAFGEGLGYTTFAYGEPTITNVPASGTFATTDTMHVEVALTNTGERKGTEVAQLYIGDIVTSYSWTDRELKAFQRVELEPGETKTVAFDIPVSECTIVDSDANRIVEPGEFEVLIGHSSRRRDLKRTTFTVA